MVFTSVNTPTKKGLGAGQARSKMGRSLARQVSQHSSHTITVEKVLFLRTAEVIMSILDLVKLRIKFPQLILLMYYPIRIFAEGSVLMILKILIEFNGVQK